MSCLSPSLRASLRMGLWGLLFAVPAILHAQALSTDDPVDLGATLAQTHARLGAPQRTWSAGLCPKHRLEMRRTGSRRLKLVYGPDERLLAAGIFQLAPPQRGQRVSALRWPGLRPGFDAQRAYPAVSDWRPWLWTLGAKQWLWFEQGETAPAGRQRYLGGVMVSAASGFAMGTNFPFDLAEAVMSLSLSGAELQQVEFARPLLAWRKRTRPNAYLEALDSPNEDANCDPASLVTPDYTDMKP
ncbi:MAG: hypothetical protein J0H09_08555 [Burkholderiales bacterium]|nr:hypothetical protein [Burkholderiales bacterium]